MNISRVRLSVRERHGRIFISSEDVPGLYLWGSDPDKVWQSVIPAIKSLFKHNEGREVEVSPDQPEPWSQAEHIPTVYIVKTISVEQTAH